MTPVRGWQHTARLLLGVGDDQWDVVLHFESAQGLEGDSCSVDGRKLHKGNARLARDHTRLHEAIELLEQLSHAGTVRTLGEVLNKEDVVRIRLLDGLLCRGVLGSLRAAVSSIVAIRVLLHFLLSLNVRSVSFGERVRLRLCKLDHHRPADGQFPIELVPCGHCFLYLVKRHERLALHPPRPRDPDVDHLAVRAKLLPQQLPQRSVLHLLGQVSHVQGGHRGIVLI
mmetsp:Transcript_5325/g.15897  ORF Transcript_5325/g.15897 Transcript_5325/m.15897 type:complete len:227 (-) Transcript_5325:253-933(-)